MSVSEAERSFRSNSLTNAEGQLSLLNLGPGEYFIKPLRKEYTFNPANKVGIFGHSNISNTFSTCMINVCDFGLFTRIDFINLYSGVMQIPPENNFSSEPSQVVQDPPHGPLMIRHMVRS